MCDLAAIAAATKGVGTLLAFQGQRQAAQAAEAGGIATRQAFEFEAQQAEVRAGQERAAAQRRMLDEKRKTALVQSRLTARAAASGAGAADPTVATLAQDIAGEGELRALTALYEGEERARSLESGAAVRRYEGEVAVRAGRARKRSGEFGAYGTLLAGFGSLADKYGEAMRRKPKPWIDPDLLV